VDNRELYCYASIIPVHYYSLLFTEMAKQRAARSRLYGMAKITTSGCTKLRVF